MSRLLEFLLLNAAACTVLACLVWTIGLMPAIRRRPALRYGLWMIVLVKLVTPPIVELRLLPHWRHLTQSAPVEPAAKLEVPVDFEIDTPAQIAGPITAVVPLPPEPVAKPAPSIDWKPWLLAAHVAGVLIIFALSLRQIRRLRRTLKYCECDDPRIVGIVQSAADAMGLGRAPRVSLVNASVPPLLWVGRNGPLIVLPSGLADELSDEQLTCVVSHEMAHYLRRDHWGNAASWLVSAVFWWHPVVWWVRRELRTSQEACCDALVISRSVVSRQSYAKTLFQALEFLQSHRAPVPALASGFGGKSSTQRRFEMIANPKVNHRLSWWNYLLLLAALAALPFWPGLSSAEEIALGDCPSAVQTTLKALQGAGQIIKIERDADGEEQFYEAEVAINGKVYDVRVSGQGTLLSTVYSRVAETSGDVGLNVQSIDLRGGGIELVFSDDHDVTEEDPEIGVQRITVVEEQNSESPETREGVLEIHILEDHAAGEEAAAVEEVRRIRIAEDHVAHVEQLQAEIARLMEQLKLLEANAAQSENQEESMRHVLRDLVTTQQRIAEEERMRAVEAEQRARAELDAQAREAEVQRQNETEQELVLRDRVVREYVVQQQQRAMEQQQLAEQQVRQAEARQRLIGGLPEAIRNTLDREAANGSITRISVTSNDAGAVTYTAHVRYQTDSGPRVYEISISEQGELIHKTLLQVRETQVIEVRPDGVQGRSESSVETPFEGGAPPGHTRQDIRYFELILGEPAEPGSSDASLDQPQGEATTPEAGATLELQVETLESGELLLEPVQIEVEGIRSYPAAEATLSIPSADATLGLTSEGDLILQPINADDLSIRSDSDASAGEEVTGSQPSTLDPAPLVPAELSPATEEPAATEPAPEEAPGATVSP